MDTAFALCVLRQKTHICMKNGACWNELAWLTFPPKASLKTVLDWRLINKVLRGDPVGKSMSVISDLT